eukprot:318986-Prymnesium_polylepis.2
MTGTGGRGRGESGEGRKKIAHEFCLGASAGAAWIREPSHTHHIQLCTALQYASRPQLVD